LEELTGGGAEEAQLEAEARRKYRLDVEILYDILSSVVESGEFGIKKTHLTYKTNLNSRMLAKYLDLLEKADCVEEVKFGKLRLVRLKPRGMRVYSALRVLYNTLFSEREPPEAVFAKKEVESKLAKKGFYVKTGHFVIGASGLEHQPDLIAYREATRYMIYLAVGRSELENRIIYLDALTAAADVGSRCIFVTEVESLARSVPERLRDRLFVVAARPLDDLAERIAKVMLSEGAAQQAGK